ncbi:MAG: nucleotidyltransferase domain-containing protein [Ignisphaera sp.]
MDRDIEKIIEVLKDSIPDVKIVLFGSRARGNALKTSDIDIIVVSRVFETMHFTDRASYILKILWKNRALPKVDIDILCYTPEEFEKKKKEIGIVREALSHGIEL